MDERRVHPRLNLPLECHYSLDGSNLEQAATLLNLSAGGAGLQLPRPLDIGAQLDFRFVLPPDAGRAATPILARAEVVRTERAATDEGDFGFLIGLRFVELGADSLQLIQQFVFARLTKGRPRPEEMPLERRRVEIHTPISIRFGSFEEFESEVSENLSLGGMFIRSDHPKPPGSIFTFEHQLGDGFPLVSGRAEVVWTRTRNLGPRMAPGMGVRFLELDGSSRNVVRRLVQSRLPEGEVSAVAVDQRAASQIGPHRISRPTEKTKPAERETPPGEIEKLRRELARRTKEFSDQEERLKLRIMELTNREVEHQDRLRSSQSSLDAADTRVRELQEALAERESRLAEAGHERDGLSARLRETSGAREALAIELESLNARSEDELASLRQRFEAATATEDERRRRIEELESENAAARRRLEDLEYREAELRKDNEEVRDELERVRRVLREKAEKAELELESQTELARRLEDRDAEIETLRADLARSIEAGRDAEKLLLAELGSARTDFERLESELHSARAHESDSKAAESELREKLDLARAELTRERETSEATESGLRAEMLQAISKADRAAADAGTLAAETAKVGAELERTRSEHEEAIEALEATNRQLNAKIARLEAAEAREPEPPTAELLLDPVGPAIEAYAYPEGERKRRSRSWIAVPVVLVAAAIAALLFSPLGERLRASGAAPAEDPVAAATESATTTAEQAARRERLAGSLPRFQPESEEGPDSTLEEPAGQAIEAVSEATSAEAEPEAPAVSDEVTVEDPSAVVGRWARAWSEQRVEDYLGFYSAGFVPAKGRSRAEWEAYRRDRLTAPRRISVTLSAMTQEKLDRDRTRVVFDQSYQADAYSDRVRKTLILVRENGGWRIARESSESIS